MGRGPYGQALAGNFYLLSCIPLDPFGHSVSVASPMGSGLSECVGSPGSRKRIGVTSYGVTSRPEHEGSLVVDP